MNPDLNTQNQTFVDPNSNINIPPSAPPAKTMNGMVAALLILLIGVLATVGGYFIAKNAAIPKSYSTTNGQIKSSAPGYKGNYDVGIVFTVNSEQYSFISQVPTASATHDSVYFIGNNTIKVAYNPQNPGKDPKNASDTASPIAGKAFEIIGGIFAVLGLISLVQQLIVRVIRH